MADTVVEVQGLKELQKLLNSEQAIKNAKLALKSSGLHVKSVLNKYPSLNEANYSRGFNTVYSVRTHKPMNTWYERGFGPKRVRKDGSVTGRKTSEMLGRSVHAQDENQTSWKMKQSNQGLTQTIGSNASYAAYVMDADHQNRIHGARGWKTVQKVAKEQEDFIVKYIRDAIAKGFHTK